MTRVQHIIVTALFSFLCLAGLSLAAHSDSILDDKRVQELVRQVDTLRIPLKSGRMFAHITLVSNGTETRPLPFLVDFSGARERRVETLGGIRKGQRVLLTSQGYWLFMQGISKPVRLTRLQRMLGQASFGDIGNLRFAEDYRIVSWSIEDNGWLKVQLVTIDPGRFVEDVSLLIDPVAEIPLRVAFMYPSGKIFKLLEFSPPDVRNGIRMIRTMRFVSPDDPNRFTKLEYSNLHPQFFAKDYFTVNALIRQ